MKRGFKQLFFLGFPALLVDNTGNGGTAEELRDGLYVCLSY